MSLTEHDETHDPALKSWVASANLPGADFPIQNLPFGVFSVGHEVPRGGVAIGDLVLDMRRAVEAHLFSGEAHEAAEMASEPTLNRFMALPPGARAALRFRLSELLATGSPDQARLEAMLLPIAAVTLHLPVQVRNYTDFYAGLNHATNVGALFRPDNPLLPNYKYVPIGYHGRASSVVPSGKAVTRPNGQRKPASETVPTFGPCRNLDYELELGVFVGPGNAQGTPIPIDRAVDHIVGLCLLNDWSARDIQGWEYQPLGPFLAKNFATTISPWVVTAEALAPFRVPQAKRPEGDPEPLPYLFDADDQASGAFALTLEVLIVTEQMHKAGEAPHRLSRGTATDLYWTVAQLVTHHSSGGCNLEPGDLLGSGTISGTTPDSYGSLLEMTAGGKQPVSLPNGETRRFLEDGDEIILRATAERPGHVSIGFGECRARVMPAPTL